MPWSIAQAGTVHNISNYIGLLSGDTFFAVLEVLHNILKSQYAHRQSVHFDRQVRWVLGVRNSLNDGGNVTYGLGNLEKQFGTYKGR